ncbi:unnamed protein product [Nippostrongylus brasiliensis]|uniref:ANF_receptor domain-containing protein n=1 Tax=Nippostrongylus brasiliensis TaxID=27835 RepID=A0A0N4YR84_NIPBR|nr:unnamed protein product [Nippostrongylus brasiliensis]
MGGIYTASEVLNMIDQLMFGAEGQAAYAQIAGKVLNHPLPSNGMNLPQLIPSDHLEQVAESMMYKAWNRDVRFTGVITVGSVVHCKVQLMVYGEYL